MIYNCMYMYAPFFYLVCFRSKPLVSNDGHKASLQHSSPGENIGPRLGLL